MTTAGNYPFGETVQVLDGSVTSVDGDGNDVRLFPVKATYEQCAVAPSDANASGGNEYTDARDLVIVGLAVFLPPDAAVEATDRIRVRGLDWEVVGQPAQWSSPFTGWSPGMPVALRRVTG